MTRGKTNRKRRNRIIAVAVMLALLLVACGSENGDDTKDADTQEMTEPEKKTEDIPATPAGQTLDNENLAAGADTESKGTPINDLSLKVDEILEDSFMAKEILTDDQGNAGEIAVLDPEEATQLKVIFTEQTTFTVRTSADMGATYADAQGTSADLEVGSSVEVSGAKDGDTVYASTVMIMKFS